MRGWHATILAGCLLAGCLGTASPSAAQDKPVPALKPLTPTGSHITQNPTALTGERLHRFFDDMATCVVRRSPERADHFLRMSDDFGMAEELGNVIKFLPLPSCVDYAADPGSIESMARFTPSALRNWLSEKAYLAANKSFASLGEDAPPVPARTYFTRDGVMRAQAFGMFSDCIVRNDAQAADALIRTERGSAAERAAARGLVPAMSECLTADQTLSLDQGTIRGLAAQGLWQRYEAPKPARYEGKN